MRLQLQILRHSFPPVSILFPTASSPSSHTSSKASTIADLLHDVNEVIPLESSDGEWGLEDYVVELPSLTEGDFDNFYECLHYQTIDSVLREDDDVIIRCLGSDEIKERRRGGRMQITSDGRHLIDGVVFGRKWIKPMTEMGRPGITIPPRKRRRVLISGEEAETSENTEQQLLLTADGEDEEDDEDYIDELNGDKENIIPDKSVQLRLDFDNIDQDENETEDDSSSSEDIEDDELQKLLKDAKDLEAAEEPVEAVEKQLMTRSSLGKRKRLLKESQSEEEEFNGFSTPVTSPFKKRMVDDASTSSSGSEDESSPSESGSSFESESASESDSDADSVSADITGEQARKVEANQVDNEAEEEDESDDDYESAASSSSADDNTPRGTKRKSRPLEDFDETSSSSSSDNDTPRANKQQSRPLQDFDDTSSSGSSESSSDGSDSDGSSYDSDPDSDSSSDTGSSSTSSSESDAADSISEVSEKVLQRQAPTQLSSTYGENETSQVDDLTDKEPLAVPPGQGLQRTKRNNNRTTRRKRLNTLKASGVLGPDATFADLTAYEDGELETAREKALATIVTQEEPEIENSATEAVPLSMETNVPPSEPAQGTQPPQSDPGAVEHEAALSLSAPSVGTKSTPSSQRSRLDVAASRRLLFGSLGLRNPKTAKEEEALKEKLRSSSQRANTFGKSFDVLRPGSADGSREDNPDEHAWRQKLIVSAVDCDRGGMPLPPPPFPFEQKWWKKLGRPSDLHAVSSDIDSAAKSNGSFVPVSDLENATHASKSTNGRESKTSDESRTLSFEKEDDGIPVPTDFSALLPLQPSHLLSGAVIAYKELHVSRATNFQPEISSYRVARIILAESDDTITVCLSTRDRAKQLSADHEEESNPFEVQIEQEQDDGNRNLSLSAMIEPKLVEASTVQVPNSNPSQMGLDGHNSPREQSPVAIPESAVAQEENDGARPTQMEVEQLEIDTPRHKEISLVIKEAGFDSAIDERLLQSNSAKSSEQPNDSQDSARDPTFVAEVVERQGNMEVSDTALANPTEWSSSPRLHSGMEDPVGGFDEEIEPSIDLPNITSSPPISPQLTVDYPHVSQLELVTSTPAVNNRSRNSSSHQDAQRVPTPPNADLSFSVAEEKENVVPVEEVNVMHDDQGDESQGFLASEIPPLQPQSEAHDNEDVREQSSPNASSFLGVRGYDGHDSSYHKTGPHSENDNIDSQSYHPDDSDNDSLPSLRELTASQMTSSTSKDQVTEKVSRLRKSHPSQGESVSPPPVRRSTRRSTARFSSAEVERATPVSESQPSIKISASQSEPKRLSQIPLGSQIVDLTLSSDPVSPRNSDGEYSQKTRAMLKKTATGRKSIGAKSRSKVSNGIMKPKKAMSDLSLTMNTSDDVDGIGTRRFLTQKKSRSQV